MLTRKFAALISISCLVVSVFWGAIGFSQSPQSSFKLTTEPPLAEIQPGHDLVRLTLQALNSSGQPLNDSRFHVRLSTPAQNPWFTTDFPIVEGTELLDLNVDAPEGLVTFQQVFPIRGNYQLSAEATPLAANAFAPTEQTLSVSVPENPAKYRNLLILVIILFAAGWLGGWIIGQQQPIQIGEIAPQRVRLLLSGAIVVAIVALLVVNVSSEFGEHEHGSDAQASAPSVQSQGIDLQLSGDTHATVGQLADLVIQATDVATGQPVDDVIFNIKATQIEHNELVFAYQGVSDSTGRFGWQQQFFDGAPHQVEVEVTPQPRSPRQFKPFQVSQFIEVDGIAPPLTTRLISSIYFTSIVVLGLLVGLWQRRARNMLVPRPSHH